MEPFSISLPPPPAKAPRAPEPAPPLNFGTFVDAVEGLLKDVRARLEQRQEDAEGVLWWLTFNRASCLYRFTRDRRTETLVLEKGQGSFVPNTPPTWRPLDVRPQADPDFETSLPLVKEMLARFIQP